VSDLLLIDGNSLTYRAFFALPTDMATSSGQVTNAVYGFSSMLATLLRDHEPDGIAVAFDRPEKTFRHERLPSYKANRDSQPDILYEQLSLVRELVDALGLLVIDAEGYEADDVLATLATMARDAGRDVLVVTGDRDSYQLVEDPHIRVLYNKRGVSDYALYDEAGIVDRTGVHPRDYVAYAALRGDPSDNLPGVPGVGEKTAAKLINAHGGLDGIFAATADQTPKLRENLEANEEHARRNVEMMTLVREVPLGVGIADLERRAVDVERAEALFDLLELATARDRLLGLLGVSSGGPAGRDDRTGDGGPATGGPIEVEVVPVTAATELEEMLALHDDRGTGAGAPRPLTPIAVAPGGSAGLALSVGGDGPVRWLSAEMLADEQVVDGLLTLFDISMAGVAADDTKALLHWLAPFGIGIADPVFDVGLAEYLLNPSTRGHDLAEVLARHTPWELPDVGAPEGQLDLDGETRDPAVEAALRARAIDLLHEVLPGAIEAQGMTRVYREVELPLVPVLARMEMDGVGVDVAELTRLRDELTEACALHRSAVHAAAGQEFNVNSTKQLQEVLFDTLGLTPGKKTKTGYSTDAATLERLRGDHAVVDHLLAYREVEKLRSTYGEGLLAEVDDDGRIRATFNQTVARTGRLSSDAPNLHNIPVRTEAGRAFRRAFVPSPGHLLLVADYNQIELRCIAHLAGDPGLIAAFDAGDDIHSAVAAQVWHIDAAEVTSELRNRAKMVAYGLAYGMEAYGLAQRLDVPVDEAGTILDAFFTAFPGIRTYMDQTVADARDKGYTETLFGRRRPIPELSSGNFNVRQAGERQAMNAGIQGLAADIFKVALINLAERLHQPDTTARLILQVHDEVILEVRPDEVDDAMEFVPGIMGAAYDLRVDLAVDVAVGSTWADAKG